MRKLQKIGESLFVSLPKTWVRQMQLNRGDTVELLEQQDGSIVVYPKPKEDTIEQTTLNVAVNESLRSLSRRVRGAFVDGFDIIVLKAIDKFTGEQQDSIREITNSLFGLEIIEVTSNLIRVQCLLTKSMPIEETIQRIHSIVKSMLRETFSALKERNPKAVKSVINRTDDVRRLSFVVHRLLRSPLLFPTTRTQETKPIDSVDFLRVIDKITEISRSVRKIAESVSQLEQPIPDAVLEPLLNTCVKVLNTYDWSIQALMSKDVSLANRALDEELEPEFDVFWDFLSELEEKTEITAPVFSCGHRILDNLKQISIYTQEIAEIAIDRAEEYEQK